MLFYLNAFSLTKLLYDNELIVINVNPERQTEIILPSHINDLKGTVLNRDRYSVVNASLTIGSLSWERTDERFKRKIILLLRTKNKYYQFEIRPDFDVTETLYKVSDKIIKKVISQEDEDDFVYKAPTPDKWHHDEIFVKFIKNNGSIPFYTSKGSSIPRYRTSIKHLFFRPIRIVTVDNFDLFYGILGYEGVNKRVKINIKDPLEYKSFLQKTRIFKNRPGQFWPKTRKQSPNMDGIEVFYMFQRY